MTDVNNIETIGPRVVKLRPLVDCSPAQQAQVREIRNQDGVRAAMYTDHLITIAEHERWLVKLAHDATQIVFAVLNDDDHPIGVISLNALDRKHQKSDWAFYLSETERGGLGAALEFQLIEFAFNALQLRKLNCEVIETNDVVVRLHKKFHFAEEGLRRSNVEKNGQRIGVYLLGLTREDWFEHRAQTLAKYASVFSKFAITLEYERQPAE
ncbi:UDP-4-amino-4,6-dideoxy-N-acetyl-beta-L-altrosamine N-acetyltransferase [Burkholderia sp. AW49-1]